MIVLKFGGAVLNEEVGFLSMVDIIKQRTDKCIIVISAFSDITRSLDSSMQLALKGNIDSAMNIIDDVMTYHWNLAASLSISATALETGFHQVESLFKRLLKGISLTREISAKTRDLFLSQGEEIAVVFIKELLSSKNIESHLLDARKIIVTDNTHGHAKPIEYHIQYRLQEDVIPLFEQHDVMIIAGFIGSNEHGETTTMGYESSNLTASILGSILHAYEIQIWTDVAGIRSVDPKLCANNIPIRKISFNLANILANNGSKLLHHWMIDLPKKYNVPVSIRNAYDSNGEYTLINDEEISIIPTIFIVTDSKPIYSQALLTIITTNSDIVHSLYEYCANNVNHQIQLSTFITPYLHTLSINGSFVQDVIERLHNFIEDKYETSS